MYKIRLREWGLRKNRRKNTASRTDKVLSPASVSSESAASSPMPSPPSTEIVRQRPRASSHDIETATFIRHVMPPEDLQSAEEMVYALRAYVQAASITQVWIQGLANPVGARYPSFQWALRMFCACHMLSRGETIRAFSTINTCCAEYKAMVQWQHPDLFPALMNIVFCLEARDPALANAFLSYAYGLGEVYPSTHPINMLTRTFRKTTLMSIRQFSRFILEGYKMAVQDTAGRHRGAVGRDISTHLLAYQGYAEFADDLVQGKSLMEAALEHWPRWFKVSADSCDPSFRPTLEAFERLLSRSDFDEFAPPRTEEDGCQEIAERWDTLCEQVCGDPLSTSLPQTNTQDMQDTDTCGTILHHGPERWRPSDSQMEAGAASGRTARVAWTSPSSRPTRI